MFIKVLVKSFVPTYISFPFLAPLSYAQGELLLWLSSVVRPSSCVVRRPSTFLQTTSSLKLLGGFGSNLVTSIIGTRAFRFVQMKVPRPLIVSGEAQKGYFGGNIQKSSSLKLLARFQNIFTQMIFG